MWAAFVQVDPVFEGLKGGPGTLIKYNPLSNVSSAEVWNFLRAMVCPCNVHQQCIHTSVCRTHSLLLLLLLMLLMLLMLCDKNILRPSPKLQFQQVHLCRPSK